MPKNTKKRKANQHADRIDSLSPSTKRSRVAKPNMRVIFGGSFDPIHKGHCQMIDHLCEQFPDAQIHIMPNNQSPFKTEATQAHVRVAMIERAIMHKPQVHIDMTELSRGGESFTLDTLAELRSLYGEKTPLVWVFGDDVMNDLHEWGNGDKLLDYCHFYIFEREGLSPHADVKTMISRCQTASHHSMSESARGSIYIDEKLMPIPISSTEIRDQLRHRHVCHDLPDGVESIIREHGLYGTDPTSVSGPRP